MQPNQFPRSESARKKHSSYGNSYKGINLAYFSNIRLPPSIKCSRCMKIKRIVSPTPTMSTVNFSEKAILELQYQIYTRKHDFSAIVCSACTAGPASELQCSRCEKVQGLNEFSARQRTFGDDRQCKDCVREIQDGNTGVDSQRIIEEDYRYLNTPSRDDSDDDESHAGTEQTNFNSVTDDSISECLSGLGISSNSGRLPLGDGVRITFTSHTQSILSVRSAASINSASVTTKTSAGPSSIVDDNDFPDFSGEPSISKAPDSDDEGDWE